ncbi:MAG: hypothetical protein R3B95_19420 [Nitrospirales bacterium]|nr:hypothetical protein [Nitrospirales bacterium]
MNLKENWKDPRFLLAIGVLGFSLIGVFLLSCVVLVSDQSQNKLDTAKTVLAAILPLLGTWVGTVLAYYFSKENFESANQNVREMVKLTSMEKLQSIRVKDAMIPLKDIDVFRVTKQDPMDKALLMDKLIEFANKNKRNRIPIVDENDLPLYVIHRSLIDRFIVDKHSAGISQMDMKKLTLKDLVETSSENIQNIIKVSFGTIQENDTLADAKREMERENYRLDVFVTKDGTAKSSVVGWLTNLIISERAKV